MFVRHSKIGCPTSGMGQKRTFPHIRPMSALPPQKRTSFTAAGMSALCHKQTPAAQQKRTLFVAIAVKASGRRGLGDVHGVEVRLTRDQKFRCRGASRLMPSWCQAGCFVKRADI